MFVLVASKFWSDVNQNIDTQISFTELEEYFKVIEKNSSKKDSGEKKDDGGEKKKTTDSVKKTLNFFCMTLTI